MQHPTSNYTEHPSIRLARLEERFCIALQRLDAIERESAEKDKDREALLKYVLWRLVIFLGALIGALASKGSIKDSLTAALGSLI
jgi:fatty acid desaturase